MKSPFKFPFSPMNRIGLSIVGLIWAGSHVIASADTAAEESFRTDSPNYSVGALVGQSPLTPGFTGAWLEAFSGAGSPDVITGGLSYTDGSNSVANAGGAVEYAAEGATGRCGRLLSQSINDGTSQSIYFSFMVKLDTVAASYRAVEFHDGGFEDGGNRKLQIAVGQDIGSGVTSDFVVRLFDTNADGFAGNLGAADTDTNFFVGKLTLGTDNDADGVEIWRNPADLTNPGPADFSKSGFNLQIDRVSLAKFASDGITVDEIRFGTSWDEVVTPSTRDVTFQVNMRVMQKLGRFNPATDEVRVAGSYWDNYSTSLAPLLSDGDADGIYSVTVPVLGVQGSDFGGYKFWSNSSTLPPEWNGFERGFDRTATLGAAATPQTLPADYFRNDNLDGLGVYYQWADESGLNLATAESEPTSDPDGDGIDNGAEYFMGTSASDFTPNPAPIGGLVTWPRASGTTISSFKVEVSTNLGTWTDASITYPGSVDTTSDPNQVVFTLPTGLPKIFARLSVNP